MSSFPSNMASPGFTTAVSTTENAADHRSGHADFSDESGFHGGSLVSRLRARLAFTLVEMLVVMGVMILLIGVTVPVFKNMVGGRGVELSINNVTGMLELARATAISNRTYVFVMFKNVVNSDNNWELRCAAVQSQTGMNYFDPTILKPITKLVKIPSVKNVKFSQMPQAVQKVTPSELASDGSYIAGWYASETASAFPQVIIDGEDFKGATYIRFDQDGEIGTSADPYQLMVEPKICLGLIATRGTALQTKATDGAIVAAYGGSGKMRIIRP